MRRKLLRQRHSTISDSVLVIAVRPLAASTSKHLYDVAVPHRVHFDKTLRLPQRCSSWATRTCSRCRLVRGASIQRRRACRLPTDALDCLRGQGCSAVTACELIVAVLFWHNVFLSFAVQGFRVLISKHGLLLLLLLLVVVQDRWRDRVPAAGAGIAEISTMESV